MTIWRLVIFFYFFVVQTGEKTSSARTSRETILRVFKLIQVPAQLSVALTFTITLGIYRIYASVFMHLAELSNPRKSAATRRDRCLCPFNSSFMLRSISLAEWLLEEACSLTCCFPPSNVWIASRCVACCVLRVACCVLRVACCMLRVACCVLRRSSLGANSSCTHAKNKILYEKSILYQRL